MTTQNVFTGIVVTVVLLLALIGANVYFVQPSMSLQLAQVEPLPPEGPGGPAADKNMVAATLAQIGAVKSGEAGAEPFTPRQVARNPFLWPGEREALEAAKQPAPVAETQPEAMAQGEAQSETPEPPPVVVSMILIGQKKKTAVVNDQFVKEGEAFQDGRIYRIEKDAVVLLDKNGKTRRVEVGELTFAFMHQPKKGTPQPEAAAAGLNEMLQPLGEAGPALAPAMGGVPSSAAQQEAVQRLMDRLSPLMTAPGSGS